MTRKYSFHFSKAQKYFFLNMKKKLVSLCGMQNNAVSLMIDVLI